MEDRESAEDSSLEWMKVDPLPRRSPRLQRLKTAGTNKTQESGSKRRRSVDKDELVRL